MIPRKTGPLPNRRKSCVFCIMGCGQDLANGADHHPGLLDEITALEHETGWTFFADESLAGRIARHRRGGRQGEAEAARVLC